jgi:hypothetical protein
VCFYFPDPWVNRISVLVVTRTCKGAWFWDSVSGVAWFGAWCLTSPFFHCFLGVVRFLGSQRLFVPLSFSSQLMFASLGSFALEPDSDNPGNPVVGKRELVGSVPFVRRYSGV